MERAVHLGGIAAVAPAVKDLSVALSAERLALQRELHASARHSRASATYQSLVCCHKSSALGWYLTQDDIYVILRKCRTSCTESAIVSCFSVTSQAVIITRVAPAAADPPAVLRLLCALRWVDPGAEGVRHSALMQMLRDVQAASAFPVRALGLGGV